MADQDDLISAACSTGGVAEAPVTFRVDRQIERTLSRRAVSFALFLSLAVFALPCIGAEPLIHVDAPEGTPRGAWPVRIGVPLAKGAWPVARRAVAQSPAGAIVPSQSKVLTTWQGGEYAKFLLVTFEADLAQRGPYKLVESNDVQSSLARIDGAGNVQIDTGKVKITVPASGGGGGILESVEWFTTPIRLRIVDENNIIYRSGDHERSVTLEENGPYSAVVRVSGWYESDAGAKLNQYIVRIYAYRGSDFVRMLHTFVNTGQADQYRYREIAMDLPARGGEGPAVVHVQDKTTEPLIPAELRSGGVRVAVRDFRLQHPCGYERFADGRVAVQFWSPHQSRLFDLRPMQFLANHDPRAVDMYQLQAKNFTRKHEMIPELGGTLRPTGIGLAKTHDVTIQLGRGDAPLPVDHPPFAYVDPAYACATGAMQPMFPKSPGRFDEAEKLLVDYVEGFYAKRNQKTLYYPDSYGYFNFGDIKHQAGNGFHRYWSHAFYATQRSFWYLYFRSGDRRVRELAEQNSRHVMDLDTGHFTDPNNEHSRAGGTTNDDSGLFHQDGYTPQNDNTMDYADYLTYMHQMTGDERAKEVALEVADACKWLFARRKPEWAHRATGQGLKQITSLYELTWDEDLRPIIDLFAKQIVEHVRDGVTTGYGGEAPADFTLAYIFPGAIAYHRLTGDAAMRDWIIANADYLVRNGACGVGGYFPKWDGMAYAALLTGDRRYVDPAWRALNEWTKKFDPVNDWAGTSFGLAKTPMVLLAASRFDAPPALVCAPLVSTTEIAYLHETGNVRRISAVVSGPTHAGAFELIKQFEKKPAMVLRGPDGSIVQTSTYPAEGFDKWYASGGWITVFDFVAQTAPGVYRIQLINMPEPLPVDAPYEHDKSLTPAWMTVSADGPSKMMARIDPRGLPPNGRYGHGRFHFFVPSAASKIAVSVQPTTHAGRTPLRLLNPAGQVVAETPVPLEKPRKWYAATASASAAISGSAWSVEIPDLSEFYRIQFDGVAPYITDDASRVFDAAPAPR